MKKQQYSERDKERINILLHVRNKLSSMAVDYNCSSTFVDNRLTNPMVDKKFELLIKEIDKQLYKQFKFKL